MQEYHFQMENIIRLKIIKKSSQIMENQSKIVPKSIQHLSKINEQIVLDRLGPEVAVAGGGPAPQVGPGNFAQWFLIFFLDQNKQKEPFWEPPKSRNYLKPHFRA